ncbi:MAG TPA: MucB/RseB C-terminal domain-containing protein [Burkholderiaceae bacterium]|nr:MucB/RseB C-terminal domain-containing protein [Burkholderiaceae bacterium]
MTARHRPLGSALLLAAACLAAPVARAQTPPADAPAREVRSWLLRIHEAASHRNFQGTFVVSGGGSVSSARIAHFCEGPNQFERSEALDGQARRVYRHNEVVTTLWPGTKVALVEQRDSLAQFPALLQAGDDHIAEFYDVRAQGVERVAGREANVLVVKPRDALRYGYRLWADQASGLLLRADVLGERGAVLESSAFSDVSIGVKPQPETVLQPMKRLDGYRVVRPALTPTQLEAEGWSMRRSVPGFRQVSCVKRPMDAAGRVEAAVREPQVLQAIFSDGLTYVSVFIEPFDPQRHTRPMLASVGPTQTLMQQQGDWWVTVVGDVPPATLRVFASGLERRAK